MQSRRSLKEEVAKLKEVGEENRKRILNLVRANDEYKFKTDMQEISLKEENTQNFEIAMLRTENSTLKFSIADITSSNVSLEEDVRRLESKNWRKEYIKILTKLKKITDGK